MHPTDTRISTQYSQKKLTSYTTKKTLNASTAMGFKQNRRDLVGRDGNKSP